MAIGNKYNQIVFNLLNVIVWSSTFCILLFETFINGFKHVNWRAPVSRI